MTTFLRSIAPFVTGFLIGCSFMFILSFHNSLQTGKLWRSFPNLRNLKAVSYKENFKTFMLTKNDYLGMNTSDKNPDKMNGIQIDRVDNSTADQLYNKVRILCWVMTSPATLERKATHVKETWTKRCNIRLFMSSQEDKEFPAVGLPVKEGRDQLYEKTKAAFRHVLEHYINEADWFFKADDDTYAVMENMRFLLKDYDPDKPSYFGRKFKPYIKQGYMSGGAGYVLSREAVKRYIDGLDTKKCAKGGGVEDVEMGRCLSLIGVKAMDSRDAQERESFFPLSPGFHIVKNKIDESFWYWKYNYYPTCVGRECCSNYPITFHYVSKGEMYIIDFLLYDAQVYGISHLYGKYSKLPYEEKEDGKVAEKT